MITIESRKAPAAIGPYSQGIVCNGLLFASGQIAIDHVSGALVGQTVQEQAHQVMKNIEAILEEAGTDFDHVVKATCFLENIDDFAAFNSVYAQYFPNNKPARSAVGVSSLPKGAKVEVEVVAAVE